MPEPTPIAVAALVRDGQVLLVHRHPDRAHYPDCWDLPGGHVDDGETPRQAVVRECREELGVTVHDPEAVAMPIEDPALELHGFVVRRWDGEPANTEPDEHDDLGWFTDTELDGLRLANPLGMAGVREQLRRR